MLRFLLLIIVAMTLTFSGQATVLLGQDVCEQACPDDGPDGKCAPGCADCTCCPHLPSIVAENAAPAVASVPEMPSTPWREAAVPLAEPGEILDVPKPLA